jgi:hypothetical protein
MMGAIRQIEREDPLRASPGRPGFRKGTNEDRRAATHRYLKLRDVKGLYDDSGKTGYLRLLAGDRRMAAG